jgi:hypothetical protein
LGDRSRSSILRHQCRSQQVISKHVRPVLGHWTMMFISQASRLSKIEINRCRSAAASRGHLSASPLSRCSQRPNIGFCVRRKTPRRAHARTSRKSHTRRRLRERCCGFSCLGWVIGIKSDVLAIPLARKNWMAFCCIGPENFRGATTTPQSFLALWALDFCRGNQSPRPRIALLRKAPPSAKSDIPSPFRPASAGPFFLRSRCMSACPDAEMSQRLSFCEWYCR